MRQADIGSLLLDQSDEPFLSVWTKEFPQYKGKDIIQIFVRSLAGRLLTIELPHYCLVTDLKQRIQDKEGTPSGQQRIIFNGMQLEDSNTLSKYDIQQHSLVHLVLRLRGGGSGLCFADVSNSKSLRKQSFLENGPRWRTATEGINVEGYCKNRKCEAYNKCVIAKIGMGQIDIVSSQFNCPMCYQEFTPTTCGLTSCEWTYIGKKAGEQRLIKGQYTAASSEQYERFEEAGNMVHWIHLVLIAKEKEVGSLCAICLEQISAREQYLTTCGHCFHSRCMQAYIKTAGVYAACPLCRNEDFQNKDNLQVSAQGQGCRFGKSLK
eukprot:TRINITY_DN7911_c0_g1_i1.p1 TRINITY_DN7911_c0_g1~~TRINITY_DN7911_c0_g1_i1.p1  ORF type:complete len:322 (-),score=30.43 TRINITY_DN7911_c0_g1_i1:326-1291(-)